MRSSAYDLDGLGTDEAYCIDAAASGWVVYYRERDVHRDETLFASEDAACSFMLDMILKDPTTRTAQRA